MVAAGIRRGLAAGLLAGILAGVFALVAGHEPMSEATRIEESLHHADHADDPAAQEQDDADASSTDQHGSDDDAHHEHDHDQNGHEHSHDHEEHDAEEADHSHADDEAHGHADDDQGHSHSDGEDGYAHEHMFSHSTQRALLPLATIVLGLGLGGLFGLAFALLRPLRGSRGDWQASLQLGAVGWAVTVLAPTLTVPANPPGVGDATDMGARTQVYLLTIGAALATAVALTLLARRLARTSLSAPARQSLVTTATVAVATGLLAFLPSALPGDSFPAELLWRFRLVSIGSQSLLWAGVAIGVGLLWHRAAAHRAPEDGS